MQYYIHCGTVAVRYFCFAMMSPWHVLSILKSVFFDLILSQRMYYGYLWVDNMGYARRGIVIRNYVKNSTRPWSARSIYHKITNILVIQWSENAFLSEYKRKAMRIKVNIRLLYTCILLIICYVYVWTAI